MREHQITKNGRNYVLNPLRSRKGCITTVYFRNAILIYMLSVKETYLPDEFKKHIQSLNILNDNDRVFMNTRNYPIWKHHIDRAKQWLLNNKYISAKEGKFYISPIEAVKIYNKLSAYIKRK